MSEPAAVPTSPLSAERTRLAALLRLGLPLVAGMGGHALFNLVDLAMVGGYWKDPVKAEHALAAVSIASLVITAPLVFVNGISNGTASVVGQNFAAGKIRRANQSSRQALLLTIVWSVLFGVLPALFAGPIVAAFRTDPGYEHGLARDFLEIMSWNAWSGFLLLQVTANLRAVGMSVATMVLLLTSNVGNIVGNWLLVYGNLGFPEWGPIGAAWATAVARGVAALLGILVLSRAHPAVRISRSGGWRPRARFMWAVARTGLPVALQWSVRMTALLIVLLVVAPFGVETKAAFGIGTRLDTLALFAGFGWGAACAALVSHCLAQGRLDDARKVTRDSAILNVMTMAVAATFYYAFAEELIRLFSLSVSDDTPPGVIREGAIYLRVSVFAYPALALSVVWAHALNGAGSVKTPLLLDAVGLLAIQVPLTWYLSRTELGPAGAWWALVISHSLLASVYYLVFRSGRWERKRLF